MTHDALINLCASSQIDGSTDHTPITLEDAAYTLRCWQEEGGELAAETKGLTAETFMIAWNATLNA